MKVHAGLRASKLEPEVELRRQAAFFEFRFWAIVTADQDIFTKVGVCEDNGIPQHVEWSKYVFLRNQRWRQAAKSNKLNRYNLAADRPISFTFCMMTDIRVPRTMLI